MSMSQLRRRRAVAGRELGLHAGGEQEALLRALHDRAERLALVGRERGDVDEADDVVDLRHGVGDDRAAVGVADGEHLARDLRDRAGDVGGVDGQAAQRVDDRADLDARGEQPLGDGGPGAGVGERAVDEDDGGGGVCVRVGHAERLTRATGDRASSGRDDMPPRASRSLPPVASEAIQVEAGGRSVRVSSPDRVIYPATARTAEVTKGMIAEYYAAVGPGILRALRERPTTLERWTKGVHPGVVLSQRGERGGDAFYQKRVPKGAPDWIETARIEFPSGRHADEICPTEIAVPVWCAHMGTIVFHPWPVRRADVDHPDELRIDLDPQPGTDFADAVRIAGVARELFADLGIDRLSQDERQPRRAHVRPDRAEVDLHRRPPRGDRLRPRARAPHRRRDDQVVEGGARRADLRRLQPERPRPHDRERLLAAPEARRAGLDAGRVGRAARDLRPVRTSTSSPSPSASPSAAT